MICRLCLCNTNTQNYFEFFDSYGLEVSAADIVSKHFWFEPKKDDSISNFICIPCWEIVKDFHHLYKTVEKAHNLLTQNISSKFDSDELKLSTFDSKISQGKTYKNRDVNAVDFDKILNVKLEVVTDEEKTLEETITPSILGIEETKSVIDIKKPKLRKRRQKLQKEKLPIRPKEENQISQQNSLDSVTENKEKCINEDFDQSKKQFQLNSKLEDERIASFLKMICTVCEAECNNFLSLRKHFLKNHKQNGFVVCCDKKFFIKRALVDHVEKHINPESFKCDVCHKVCISSRTLRIHISRVHTNTERCHQCLNCTKTFKLKSTLIRHQLTHMSDEEKKFKCDKCDKRYPTESTLIYHIRACHDRCYDGLCDICGKTYNSKEDVQRHRLEVHEGAKQNIKCKLCFKEFTNAYQYRIHKNEEHSDPNQKRSEHRCTYCNKISANSEALKKHIRKVHKAKFKFFCSLCDKVFKTLLSLKEHKATHTGEPLYICPHCPKTFTYNSNMHTHRKLAHPVEFEEARQSKNKRKKSWMQITALQIN